jgi:electron-transferring-flavoprotein dehydrogenase
MERDCIDFDVVIVGAGPAGLSAAIALKQQAIQHNEEISVCILEKGSEVGAHILSGAIFETRALDKLIPDWKNMGAPVNTTVTEDQIYYFSSANSAYKLPHLLVPKTMHNSGNYIISLASLCRWLAQQAEDLGIEIFPGVPAKEILTGEQGEVTGIVTGDMGIAKDGSQKDSFEPGMEINGKYTLFAEGCRGHLGKQLIQQFSLDDSSDPQHYGLGIKELWEITPEQHHIGRVVHGAGWPLSENNASGGSFLYHIENNQVVVGLITDLNYQNPNLSPYEEFQKFKQHPVIRNTLAGGNRISYGARAICKGGINSLPKQHFPGGLIIGCNAGTLNFAKIKGCHSAIKSGMLAAEVIFQKLQTGDKGGADLVEYEQAFKQSWLYDELYGARNFGAALHRFGTWLGGAFNMLEQNIFNGKTPVTLHDKNPDYVMLKPAINSKAINYPKADGKISFDRLSSVQLSATNHEEDQPIHLILNNEATAITINLEKYDAPEQRYCPAGVYEILIDDASKEPRLQINAQNCLHCKTCDIKDPTQNINWTTPEGTGGPNYPNM